MILQVFSTPIKFALSNKMWGQYSEYNVIYAIFTSTSAIRLKIEKKKRHINTLFVLYSSMFVLDVLVSSMFTNAVGCDNIMKLYGNVIFIGFTFKPLSKQLRYTHTQTYDDPGCNDKEICIYLHHSKTLRSAGQTFVYYVQLPYLSFRLCSLIE